MRSEKLRIVIILGVLVLIATITFPDCEDFLPSDTPEDCAAYDCIEECELLKMDYHHFSYDYHICWCMKDGELVRAN